MKITRDFRIVSGKDHAIVEATVVALLEDSFYPQGGLAIGSDGTVYQGMYKCKLERPPNKEPIGAPTR